MATSEELMQRLAVSKKIMDKHSEIKRGDVRPTTPMVEDYQPINANYNLPEELLSESSYQKPSYETSKPLDEEKILNSKLPDEIKRLMIEQPIVQPSSMGSGTVLSNEVIEGAQRLMKKEKISDIPQTQIPKQKITETHTSSNINIGEIKSMIRDVVRDTVRDVVREELKDAGMLVESTQDTNEVIQFKVGQHLFIGRVTKIKKLEK